MRTLSSVGMLAVSALVLSAGAQPVLPMCHTVQVPDNASAVTYENDRFVPMITVKWETFGHPDYPNPICLASPATAAKYAADWLRTAPWINETGSNVVMRGSYT